MKFPTGTAIGGTVAGLALLALMVSPSFAQAPPAAPGSMPGAGPAHGQMHQTLDALQEPGTSQRMHAAMGPDADPLTDQVGAMRQMMPTMQDMMATMRQMMPMMQDMMATMDQGGMAGMTEDHRRSMQDMMAMMRQMMPMMQGMMDMPTGGRPAPIPAPAQIPRR